SWRERSSSTRSFIVFGFFGATWPSFPRGLVAEIVGGRLRGHGRGRRRVGPGGPPRVLQPARGGGQRAHHHGQGGRAGGVRGPRGGDGGGRGADRGPGAPGAGVGGPAGELAAGLGGAAAAEPPGGGWGTRC